MRDAYPHHALKHTRVLALSGMTQEALALWHTSLSMQDRNPSPVDMYFYSDLLRLHYLNADLAESLISLSKYTYPSRIVFGRGNFYREGFYTLLSWMYNNREKGYFVNLETLQVSEHQIVDYDVEQAVLNPDYLTNLTNSIITIIQNMCNDKVNFPKLKELNFNQNGYDNDSTNFASQLLAANQESTGVTILAEQSAYITYPTFCMSNSAESQSENAHYYDAENEADLAQCRFNWNWEYGGNINNSNAGPYPNENSPEC